MNFRDDLGAEITTDGVRSQGERKTGLLVPPLTQINTAFQLMIAEGELSFVDNLCGVDCLTLVLAGGRYFEYLIERDKHILEINAQIHSQR